MVSVSPIEALDLSHGLSLSPRLKLDLTFFRSDPAVKRVDEWQLKVSLLSFLRSSTSLALSVPDEDLSVKKRPDLHKRKRDDPVAVGTLYVRDLGFLKKKQKWRSEDEEAAIEERFGEWKREVVEKLGGIELNIEGVGFEMRVEIPKEEDFERVKQSWEEFYEKQLFAKRKKNPNFNPNLKIWEFFLRAMYWAILQGLQEEWRERRIL